MLNETRKIVWFRNNEIDDGWDYSSQLNENIFIVPFRKIYFILIDEKYFLKHLTTSPHILTDCFKKPLDFVGKSLSEGFDQIYKELGILIKSEIFTHQNQIDSILNKDFKRYFFFKCEFVWKYNDGDSKEIILNDMLKLTRCIWALCKLGNIKIKFEQHESNYELNCITKSFFSCEFHHLIFDVGEQSQLILNNNRFQILTTNSEYIRLKDVELYLFHHTHLDNNNNDFGFDNVSFEFNPSILRKFISETQTVGFLNTYKQLLNNDSLYSERDNIKKYVYYFTSRKHWINKTLFTFNKGYYGILFPLIVTGLLIFIKYLILLCNEELYFINNNSFVPVIYPIEMYKDIIFF